ncbi:MAG: Unknown protein [uncultured Aureispira sp.]|uniref:Uncharacterized protein n=1 Tax=uncultured Aureispira sp. TaxID=1331704 RepID=A0A6S6TR68_9BACT|nr:MAG: Unknown protein [uncultured Aureispira sp.]
MKYTLIPYWLIIFFYLGFSNPLSYAEAIKQQTTESTQINRVPIEKGKKKKLKNRNRRFKKPNKSEGAIVPSLYLTFAVLILLPLLIILGISLVGVGFPSLVFFYIGLGLILFGNLATLAAGAIAGATKHYSSQILSFGLWVLFGINLLGAIALFVLNLLLFSSLFLWVLIAILLAVVIFTLVWALIINKQNKAFRNSNTDKT